MASTQRHTTQRVGANLSVVHAEAVDFRMWKASRTSDHSVACGSVGGGRLFYEIYHSNSCLQFRGSWIEDGVFQMNVLTEVFLETF